jgi:hypothetical protein
MTHTYAVLEVPVTVYAAIRALLVRADYSHAFHDGLDGEVIDMHGIALKSQHGVIGADITVGTLLSSRTKEGRVELALNGELTQMDLDKAREVVGMLQERHRSRHLGCHAFQVPDGAHRTACQRGGRGAG